MTKELLSWELIRKKEVFSADPWFKVFIQKVKLPDQRVVDDYYQIQAPNYAVIVAYTNEGKMMLARQYRQGVGKVSLMLPGGVINENENPLAAAKRELFEETGYGSKDWTDLGSYVCNSNYGCGNAHLFIAKNVIRNNEPKGSDDLEETELLFVDPAEALKAIFSGDMVAMGAVMSVSLAINYELLNKGEIK